MEVTFWIWLAVIVVTAIVEFATMEVVSIWFTLGAIVPFILSATRAVNWIWQLVIFVVISSILIVSLRGITKKFLLKNSNEKTNVDAIVGQKFRMLTETDFETIGSLKVNDVVWSAVAKNREKIEKNSIVEVVGIQGNKLIVSKVDEKSKNVENDDKKVKKVKKGEN